jgi:hypothetical protein
MSVLNELDGQQYDPNDPDQQYCLRKAECYIDRTVDPPVIRVIKSNDDYEIVGWVWLTDRGELKSHGVSVTKGEDGRYFTYRNRRYPPGVYYLIRRQGREFLISEKMFKFL